MPDNGMSSVLNGHFSLFNFNDFFYAEGYAKQCGTVRETYSAFL